MLTESPALLIREAHAIVGGLSNPSKMPGKSYNLSALQCNVGSKLRKIPGSVCSDCYALKGRYGFRNVQNALDRRRESLSDPRWIPAMVTLIKKQSPDYFRWHDSGDIQSIDHLAQIVAVCRETPETRHWLPTRERSMLREYLARGDTFPPNLVIRESAAMVDQIPTLAAGVLGSIVWQETPPGAGIHQCPAPDQDNNCGACRACWSPKVRVVGYHKH